MVDINLLKSIPFFENFDDNHLEVIKEFFEIVPIAAKQIVLEQDAINFDLLFLIDGTVGVFVDTKFVTSMKGDGEVFGEMSIAGHTACTATVATKTECQFLKFDFNSLKGSDIILKDEILILVY